MLLLVLGGGTILVAVLRFGLGRGDSPDQALGVPLWSAALWVQGSMIAAAWVFGSRKHRVPWSALGMRSPVVRGSFALAWLALVASLAASAVYGSVASALGVQSLELDSLPRDLLGTGIELYLNVAVIGLWVPLAEEVFFRGFVFSGLVTSIGVRWGIVASSMVFALGHASPFTVGPIIPAFISGLLLAWLYHRTKSLWPSVMAHSAQNLIAVSALVVLT